MYSDEYFMTQALKVAEEGLLAGELPIGAVVVLDDTVIAAAHTQENAQQRLLVHAELLALDQADRINPFPGKHRDARLFTTLEPCLMCLGAAMSFFLGEITYAMESPGDGAVEIVQHWSRREGDFPAYQLPAIHGGVLRAESQQLFRRYLDRHPEDSGMTQWVRTLVDL